MEAGQLKIYGLGIVAINKALDSKIIEVTPIEQVPMTNGELTDNVSTITAAAKDTSGAAYQTAVSTTNTVKADWLPLGCPNRKTAPDVRRGETVVLWRFADVDKFYWATLKDDMNLRKLETVIYAFSATTNENAKNDADSTYFIEISTHQKLITLHTSQANGEPFGYDIQLNTGDGFFTIQDTEGNSITLNSAQKQIAIANSSGSFLNMIDKQIFGSSDLIDFSCKNFNLKSDITTIKATTATIDATTTHNGNFSLGGDLNMGAGANGGAGNATIQGNIINHGSITSDGTLEAEKVISIEPIEAPNVA